MLAGTHTITSLFSWIVLELLKSKTALKKTEEEIKSVFKSTFLLLQN